MPGLHFCCEVLMVVSMSQKQTHSPESHNGSPRAKKSEIGTASEGPHQELPPFHGRQTAQYVTGGH